MQANNKALVEKILEKELNVSRETFCKLETYVDNLLKWNKAINLISKSTEDDIWERHILDSAQIIKYIAPEEIIYDLGSGAGLPGIVISLLNNNIVHLVESDQRKCAFLTKIVSLYNNNNIRVINNRIEQISMSDATLITSRALATIDALLEMTYGRIKNGVKMVLLKGKTVQNEIDNAMMNWHFDYELHKTITNVDSFIVALTNITKKEG